MKGGRKRDTKGEPVADAAAYGTKSNELNRGGNGYSAPLRQIGRMPSEVREENPMQEPEKEGAETEAAAADEKDKGGNEPAEGGKQYTTELPTGFYRVEAIRAKRMRKGRKQYLIKWLGWPEETNTWEPMRNLSQVTGLIDDFERSLKSKKQPTKKRKQTVGSTSRRSVKKRNCNSVKRFSREPRVSEGADPPRITNTSVAAVEQGEAVPAGNTGNNNHSKDNQGTIRHCRFARRIIKREPRGSKAADSQRVTNISAGAVQQVEPAVAGIAENNDHSNIQAEDSSENFYIVSIIKPDSYRPTQSNTEDPTLKFLALRANSAQVIVDNHFLKEHNYHLLFNYYEQHIDWGSCLSRHRRVGRCFRDGLYYVLMR